MELQPPFRLARTDEGTILAELVNAAGEGLPLYFWTLSTPPGTDPWAFGAARQAARAGRGEFVGIEDGGELACCLLGYPIGPEIADDPPDADIPAVFVPLVGLERLAPGTWYVNILATRPRYRGRGHGARMLGLAREIALEEGLAALSLIVADNNLDARRLYERVGFEETARSPMVKGEWQSPGTDWCLMVWRFD